MVYLFAQLELLITSLTKDFVGVLQLSVAVTRLKSVAGTCPAHCTVTGPGQVIPGAVLSITVTIFSQGVVAPVVVDVSVILTVKV